MPRYRHWRNLSQGGETAFITTTCLDFNHALQRSEMKDRMVLRLASDHIHYGARLFAFVVMSNHVHLLTGLPEDRDVGWFVQRLKTNSAKELGPLLNSEEIEGFSQQQGLDARQFWQSSFRSVGVLGESMFNQKVHYIHSNPVRAGLVAVAEDYRWSSARMLLSVETEREYLEGIAWRTLEMFRTISDVT